MRKKGREREMEYKRGRERRKGREGEYEEGSERLHNTKLIVSYLLTAVVWF